MKREPATTGLGLPATEILVELQVSCPDCGCVYGDPHTLIFDRSSFQPKTPDHEAPT